jgi:hypothetical protein
MIMFARVRVYRVTLTNKHDKGTVFPSRYNRFRQRANGYGPFNFHTNKLTSRVKQYEELEDKTDNKRIKLSSEEAQRFGIAFGAAWKAAH